MNRHARPRGPALDGRGRIAVLLFWTAFGLIESTNAWVAQRQRGAGAGYLFALINNMPWWWMWAALTPVVFFIARRVRLERGSLVRGTSMHAGAALLLVAVHILAAGTLFYYTSGGPARQVTLGGQLLAITFSYLPSELLTYAAIVGAYLALEYGTRAREGELRAARLEAQASEARLSALRMELNPHFLFNALHGIAGLVRLRENETAVQMLAQLGDMLRQTLAGGGSKEVPLHDELALLDRYIAIEKMRFRDRLVVGRDIADDVRSALVPPLLLQPLVENALRHGVDATAGPVSLTISARGDDGTLELAVTDSGAGVPPAATGRNGVGLANTRARLAELYGDRASVELCNLQQGGARAIVRLPLHRAAGSPLGEKGDA